MEVVILFGAGASAFSGPCTPKKPPLGNELFDQLVEIGPPASEITEKYGQYFQDDFESGMREVSKLDGDIAIPLLRQMGKFLSSFELDQRNSYCQLIRELSPLLQNVCLATLNYDCLIEQALSLEEVKFSLKPFCKENLGPYLVKLHGSSNWLPVIPPNFILDNVSINNPDATLIKGVTTPSFFSGYELICEWHENERFSSLAPIMCNYAEGKNCMVNPEIVIDAQEFWGQMQKESKLLILMGVRYIAADKHIWDCIENSSCDIAVVNPDKDEIALIKERFPQKEVIDFGDGFTQVVPKVFELVGRYC